MVRCVVRWCTLNFARAAPLRLAVVVAARARLPPCWHSAILSRSDETPGVRVCSHTVIVTVTVAAGAIVLQLHHYRCAPRIYPGRRQSKACRLPRHQHAVPRSSTQAHHGGVRSTWSTVHLQGSTTVQVSTTDSTWSSEVQMDPSQWSTVQHHQSNQLLHRAGAARPNYGYGV